VVPRFAKIGGISQAIGKFQPSYSLIEWIMTNAAETMIDEAFRPDCGSVRTSRFRGTAPALSFGPEVRAAEQHNALGISLDF